MSSVYVVLDVTEREGGSVVAVTQTLDGAKRAAEAARHEPSSPLEWSEFQPTATGDRPQHWWAQVGDWTGYQIELWSVDPGHGSLTATGADGEPVKGWLYPSPTP